MLSGGLIVNKMCTNLTRQFNKNNLQLVEHTTIAKNMTTLKLMAGKTKQKALLTQRCILFCFGVVEHCVFCNKVYIRSKRPNTGN